jgi:hypothetical protein
MGRHASANNDAGVWDGSVAALVDTSRAALADASLGGGQFLGLGLAVVHVEADLVIGDSGAWHWGPTSS